MKKQFIALLVVSSMVAGCKLLEPKPSISPKLGETFSDIDKFFEEIATRVRKKTGASNIPDFIVIPAEAEWPIGTVLRPGTTFPADATACVANQDQIKSASAPNLFPDYANSYKNSLDLGIDNELIKRLIDAGLKFTDKDDITLKVVDSKYELIDDTTYANLTTSAACKSVLSGKELWIVRGYVVGKRTFSFSTEVDNSVKAKIEEITSFKFDFGSGSSSLKVIDDKPAKFVQIITAIKVEQGKAISSSPTVPTGIGRIYIQKDRLDTSNKSLSAASRLRESDFKVESYIESIDTSKMPSSAQVRFFNETDRELALRATEQLRTLFPKISVVKIRLPAPAGQLEVWLPRVGSGGGSSGII